MFDEVYYDTPPRLRKLLTLRGEIKEAFKMNINPINSSSQIRLICWCLQQVNGRWMFKRKPRSSRLWRYAERWQRSVDYEILWENHDIPDCKSLKAELWSLLKGLKTVLEQGMENVGFETDLQMFMDLTKNGCCPPLPLLKSCGRLQNIYK